MVFAIIPGVITAGALAHPPKSNTGWIAGKVEAAGSGRAISGINVLVKGTEFGSATDASGNYIIGNLNPGSYVLQFSAVGYKNLKLTNVAVKAGETTAVNVVLEEQVISMADVLVIGVSKRLERIKDAPAAVNKLSQVRLSQYGATGQIPGLFVAEPGIDVVQSGINDFNINARGFNSTLNRRVLVLQDNRETAMALLLAQEWNTYSLPLDALGDVEFVRGPGSALYGANAFSGVLNIQTPAPEKVQGTRTNIAFGEQNTIRADVHHAGFHEPWGYKIQFGGVRSETWNRSRNVSQEQLTAREYAGLPTEFVPLDDDDVSTIYGSARLDYNLSQGNVITAEGGVAQAEDQVFVTGIGRVQVDRVIRPWGRLNFTSDHYFFQADYNGRKTLQNHQRALNSVMTFRENSYDIHFQFQNNFKLLKNRMQLVWGASHRLQHVDTKRTLTPDSYDENQSGLFAQLEYKFSPHFGIVTGGRVDRSTLHETQFSPKAALVYSPGQNHRFRLTANRAFQTPNYAEFFLRAPSGAAEDLFVIEQQIELAIELEENLPRGSVDLPLNFGLTPRLALGNQHLDVEKVTSYELGYKGTLGKRWYATADLYLSRLADFVTDLLPGVNPDIKPYQVPEDIPQSWRQIATDFIASEIDSSFSTLPDGSQAFVVSYTNAGKVTEWGAELALHYRLSSALNLFGNYTFFDFDVTDKLVGDRLLPNTPMHKFNVGLNYRNLRGLDLSLNLRHVDDFEWASGIFQGHVPAYTTVNFAGGYKVGSDVRLGVTITNLFDNDHYELFGGSIIGRRALASLRFDL